MAKIVIGLVGEMASGKDAVKKHLNEKYGAVNCKFSTILRDVLDRLGVEKTRENMQNISTSLRGLYGEDLLAKTIVNDVSKLEGDIVIADGVRRMADIEYLAKLPNFALVKIEVKPEIRYERSKSRNENPGDAGKTFEQFMKDHEAEAEREVKVVMEKAGYSINNDGNFADLYKQTDSLVESLLK